jgi:mono/diheme cytochrome c family protein
MRSVRATFGSICFLCLLLGCRATPSGRLESSSIQWVKHHITIKGERDVNPIRSTPKAVDEGRRIFAFYCVVCHGRDGQNTGVPFADRMSPAVPNLHSPGVQSYSDGQLRWIIENGIGPSGMPASKGLLSDREIWTVVVYLRNLPPAGTLGEPRAYSEEEYAK